MQQKEVKAVWDRYRSGLATEADKALLESWYAGFEQTDLAELTNDELAFRTAAVRKELPIEKETITIRRLWPRMAAAASILVIFGAGLYYVLKPKAPDQQIAAIYKNDIAPGHNQATLTLANGQKIVLTKGLKGQLAVQGSTIIQARDNDIAYNSQKDNDKVGYNTLATARGEQSPYPLVLADGTKVWLNAQSSITFPTAFNGKERIVKLTGEAYFEVKHNARQPFRVQTEKQTIEDIGTAFNVNAYADEPTTKTTLIEGSVKVNGLVLKPDEQTDGSQIKTVNTGNITAWKEGSFHFEGDDIRAIMRQLSRWYNIEVVYQGTITTGGFYGDISLRRNISAVLKLVEKTNVIHFKIEGRRVTVME